MAGVGDRMVLAEVAVGEDRVARAAHVRAADAPASQSPIHRCCVREVRQGCDSKRVKRSSAVRNADRIIELCIDRSIRPSSAVMMENEVPVGARDGDGVIEIRPRLPNHEVMRTIHLVDVGSLGGRGILQSAVPAGMAERDISSF